MSGKINKLVATGIISVLLILSGFFFVTSNNFKTLQTRFSNSLYGHEQPSDKITIVQIDDQSINKLNGLGPYETWTRANFTKVLNVINKYQPKVVGLDIYFRDPKDPIVDNELADALSNIVNPVIGFFGDPIYLTQGFFAQSPGKTLALPYEIFRKAKNVRVASLNIPPSGTKDDTMIRDLFTGMKDTENNKFYSSFAFAIAHVFLGDDKYNAVLKSMPLEKEKMLIRYFSSMGVRKIFPSVSFLDVYNENFTKSGSELFKDKIVLIGGTFNDSTDKFSTPTSSEFLMYGVEIHANAIQTILEGKFLRNMTQTEKIVLIILLSLLSVFIFMFTRIRWSLIYLVATPSVYALLAQPIFDRGIIVDLVHPFLVIATSFIAVYVYRYLTEFKEKLALKSAFSKYVNPQLAAEIAEHPEKLKLGGEKREITVLFTDIAHFTSISEKLSAESLVALLNEYLEAMTDVIQSEGGTVDKYEGDAIMALFGAPLPTADHAEKACAVALKMRMELTTLLKKWELNPLLPGGEQKPAIDFRCGINTGEVILGNVGSKSRMEYTVIGDDVNLGSRLEGQNKEYDTRIMISEFTYEKVKDKFECREIDLIKVVGKNKPVKIFELLNFKGQLVTEAAELLKLYAEGIALYKERKYADGLAKFDEILKRYPTDGPSKTYRQRCEVFRDFPPKPDWDGVFEKRGK